MLLIKLGKDKNIPDGLQYLPVQTEVLHNCCSDCKSSTAEQRWLCLHLSEEVKNRHFFYKFPFEGYFWRKIAQFSAENFSLHLDTPTLIFLPTEKKIGYY